MLQKAWLFSRNGLISPGLTLHGIISLFQEFGFVKHIKMSGFIGVFLAALITLFSW